MMRFFIRISDLLRTGGHSIQFNNRFSIHAINSKRLLYCLSRFIPESQLKIFYFQSTFRLCFRLKWLHGMIWVKSKSDKKTRWNIASFDRTFSLYTDTTISHNVNKSNKREYKPRYLIASWIQCISKNSISPVCPRKRLPLTASYKQSRSLSALQAAELCINFHPSFIPKYNFHELGNKIKIQQKLNEISVLMQ